MKLAISIGVLFISSLLSAQAVLTDFPSHKLVGLTYDSVAGSLTKNEISGWDNGAFSSQELPYGTDGYVKYVVESGAEKRVFGISSDRTLQMGTKAVDYAYYIRNFNLYILQDGLTVATLGTVVTGTVLQIKIVSGNIEFYKDLTLQQSFSVAAGQDFEIGALVYDANKSINGIYTDFPAGTAPAPPVSYEIPGLTYPDFSNLYLIGMDHDAVTGTLTRNEEGWDNSALSTNVVKSGNDGVIEFIVNDTSLERIFGVASDRDLGVGYRNLDCSFYLSGARLYIHENGYFHAKIGTVPNGTVLHIKVIGSDIKFYMDGNLIAEFARDMSADYQIGGVVKNNGQDRKSVV